MWSTRMDWNGTSWVVHLSRGATVIATMTLDEWTDLRATKYAASELNNSPATQARPSRQARQ
jgi:hypothetical protein